MTGTRVVCIYGGMKTELDKNQCICLTPQISHDHKIFVELSPLQPCNIDSFESKKALATDLDLGQAL